VSDFYKLSYPEYCKLNHKGSVPTTFVIDGGNFCVDLKYYLPHYRRNKKLYTSGSGNYNFSHVWEARICKILYDQKLFFYEQKRKIEFQTVAELKEEFPNQGENWMYFIIFPMLI